MALDEMTIRNIQPRLTEASDGSWLAVSGRGAPLSVGVFGESAEDATEQFKRALDRHVLILQTFVIPLT